MAAVESSAKRWARGEPDAVVIDRRRRGIIDEVLAPYWNGKDFTPELRQGAAGGHALLHLRRRSDHIVDLDGRGHVHGGLCGTRRTGPSTSPRSSAGLYRYPRGGAGAPRGARGPARPRHQEAVPRSGRHHLRRDGHSGRVATPSVPPKWPRRETDPRRKLELEEISAVCAWVPEHPARTFREALQAQWFAQIFSRLEQNIGGQVSQGRMDQYFYPFYKKDIEEGRLTKAQARGAVPVPVAQHDAEHRGQALAVGGGQAARDSRTTSRSRSAARRRTGATPPTSSPTCCSTPPGRCSRATPNSPRASTPTRPTASCTPSRRRSRTARARPRC